MQKLRVREGVEHRMNVGKLITEFKNFATNRLAYYKDLISSKHGNDIFPPYIPHIGQKYGKYRIMMYAMAQNMDEPLEKLKSKNRTQKVRQLYDARSYNEILMAPYYVMLAVAGVYIYAKYSEPFDSFDEIHELIAATNYYKFSLHYNKRDVHPNNKLKYICCPGCYWIINDELSNKELKMLNPSVIISFRGRHNNAIIEQGFEVIEINDPAWILRGGSGVLKPGASWDKKINDKTAEKLINKYIKQIDENYKGKKESIKIYLKKYFSDWITT